ncbi:response regulator [Nibrella saemangeumensis]|uniref:Response regulator n=1 Tax=Nibrella saemangeumensis TaxID=1084526 RepID=A0ABP8MQM4_9BACT
MNNLPKTLIFIADDDEDDRYLLKLSLQKSFPKCLVRFFENGQELLEALHEEPASTLPQLILLDLNMPVMDGFATLAGIKGHDSLKVIPTVMLTTSDNPCDVKKCYSIGCNAYMTKPSNFDQLSGMLSLLQRYWMQIARLPNRSLS